MIHGVRGVKRVAVCHDIFFFFMPERYLDRLRGRFLNARKIIFRVVFHTCWLVFSTNPYLLLCFRFASALASKPELLTVFTVVVLWNGALTTAYAMWAQTRGQAMVPPSEVRLCAFREMRGGGYAVVDRCELFVNSGVQGTGINCQLGDLEAFSAAGRVFVVPTRQTIRSDAVMNGACDGCTTTVVFVDGIAVGPRTPPRLLGSFKCTSCVYVDYGFAAIPQANLVYSLQPLWTTLFAVVLLKVSRHVTTYTLLLIFPFCFPVVRFFVVVCLRFKPS